MLNVIDISNWQKTMDLRKVSFDAAVIKATEGVTFVDPYCDKFVQQAISLEKPFGFYHFARNNQPEDEAMFFWENCQNYIGVGIPVLDIEDDRIPNWGDYAQRFIDKFHAITGVWPMVYCSASNLTKFYGYPLCETCGLWVAGYPLGYHALTFGMVPDFPYDVSPWKFAAMWQFTSTGHLDGFDENVDLNVFYGDATAWELYANPDAKEGLTEPLPKVDTSDDSSRSWTFENSRFKIDVILK